MNYYNGSGYDVLYPETVGNLVTVSSNDYNGDLNTVINSINTDITTAQNRADNAYSLAQTANSNASKIGNFKVDLFGSYFVSGTSQVNTFTVTNNYYAFLYIDIFTVGGNISRLVLGSGSYPLEIQADSDRRGKAVVCRTGYNDNFVESGNQGGYIPMNQVIVASIRGGSTGQCNFRAYGIRLV